MALYTLADLHLAADVAKPMDIFGGKVQILSLIHISEPTRPY